MLYPKSSAISKLHDFIIASQGGASGPLSPNLLQAAIDRPKTSVFGFEPFENMVSKTAALAYGIIVFHPFLDGNKRTAVASMILTLGVNSIHFAIPPYIVKYTVQVALDPSNKKHISEDEFMRNIVPFCSANPVAGRLKDIRYRTIPQAVLRLYFLLLSRLTFQFIAEALVNRLLDWFAAGDVETLGNTVREWTSLQKRGYPKRIRPPEFDSNDFEVV